MRKLKLFFACLLMAVLSIGQMWGEDEVAYTLEVTTNSGNDASGYANGTDIEISNITWNATGNTTMNPWRIGGKSLSGVNRTVYSKTAMSDAITKVELTVGAASNITVNSLTLKVASNANFSTQIDEVTATFAANSTITFQPTSPLTEWSATNGVYFKFVFNVTVSGNSNKFVEFTEAKFYKEKATTSDVIVKTLKSIAVTGQTTEFDQNADFAFDGTCTATYSVTKNDVAQPDEEEEVTPTSVSTPDMSTTGEKTVTVTYEENEVSKTVDYTINVNPHTVTPGTYNIVPNDAFWGKGGQNGSKSVSANELDIIKSQNDITLELENNTSTNSYFNTTSSRAYNGYTLTVSVPTGYNLTSIVFTGGTWVAPTVNVGTMDSKTWSGEDNSVIFTFSGTSYMTNIAVTYAEVDQTIVKTLKSIAVDGMTTSYEVGETFSFDGICTATYSVTQGGVDQDDENKTVNPTSVSTPDMSTTGEKTVTVTYEENEVSKTVDYTITVNPHTVAPGAYPVLLNNVLWGVEAGQQAATVNSMEGSANDINFATTKGSSQMYASATQTRFYTNATLTISAPTGYNITSVVFAEPSADKKWDGSITVNEGTYTADTKTWSGEVNTVVFTFGAQNRIGTATVTYAAVDPTAPAVSVASSIDNVPAAGVADQVLDVTYTNVDLANVVYALFNDAECQNAFTDEWLSVSLNGDKDIVYTVAANASFVEGRTAYIQLTAPASNGTSAVVVKVIAVEQLKKEYVFASLAELLETVTPTTDAIDVTVTLTNEVIRGIATSGQYRNGVYFDVTYGNPAQTKRIELFFHDVPDGWDVGDKVSGTLTTCPWKVYSSTWELAPKTGWAWSNLTRTEKGNIVSIAVSGDATKTEYSNGENFLFDGLVATATYANGYQEIVTPDSWAADPATITANVNVAVTATVGIVTSDPYYVEVTKAAKTLESIAVGTASYTIYTGEALPEPTVTATYSEGEPEDVSALANYDTQGVFVTQTPGEYIITVSYEFGTTETTTYTVTVVDYENSYANPYTPEQALYITTHAIGETKSERNIYVQGIVSRANAVTGNQKRQRYWISIDGKTTSTEFEVYNGLYLNGADFSTSNQLVAGDEVIVVGKVIYYQSTTPEFATGESQLYSLARTPEFTIENVVSFEVGATDLAEGNLDITTPSEGEITFVSGDDTKATIVANAIHAVAPGTVTITANMAADGIYKATSTTFSVTVIAATDKYAITFDGNGNTGGSAPEAITEKAAGANVTLPANTYTKTGYTFAGWKVYDENEVEVTVTAGAFEMPASDVTIKAQWEAISKWAYVYTSTLKMSGATASTVIIGEDSYYAMKAGTGSAAGSINVAVPAGATKIHFHASGWDQRSVTLNITAPDGITVTPASVNLVADAGVSGNTSTYTLENDPATTAYFAITLSGNTDAFTLTFANTGSKKQFVLFGVNQEGGDFGSYQRPTTSGNYGTICLPYAGTISGATLLDIAYFDGAMIYCDEVNGVALKAGKPYIFYATSNSLNVAYTANIETAAGEANGLHGFYNLSNMATDAADKKDLDQNDGNYILYQNQYWLVSGRDAYINNFRAYIKLDEISTEAPDPTPGAAPRHRVAMTVNGEQTATGIGELNASETPVKMIIDGQLFIIRGEKMYNVNGQVVK